MSLFECVPPPPCERKRKYLTKDKIKNHIHETNSNISITFLIQACDYSVNTMNNPRVKIRISCKQFFFP